MADLVDHLVDEHRWVEPLLDGLDLKTAGQVVAGSRDPGDRVVAWDEAALLSYRAMSADGALTRSVELSYGLTPAPDYIGEMIVDLAVHSWDLGTALGERVVLPEGLVDFALGRAGQMDNDNGTPGVFAPAVEVSLDASALDRLVARTGRTPR